MIPDRDHAEFRRALRVADAEHRRTIPEYYLSLPVFHGPRFIRSEGPDDLLLFRLWSTWGLDDGG